MYLDDPGKSHSLTHFALYRRVSYASSYPGSPLWTDLVSLGYVGLKSSTTYLDGKLTKLCRPCTIKGLMFVLRPQPTWNRTRTYKQSCEWWLLRLYNFSFCSSKAFPVVLWTVFVLLSFNVNWTSINNTYHTYAESFDHYPNGPQTRTLWHLGHLYNRGIRNR